MKAKAKQKKFDAVKMMREIQDKLSEKYLADPTLEKEDLAAIRKKYNIEIPQKAQT